MKIKKNNYVRSWAKDYLNTNPDSEQTAAIGAIEGHVQVVARAGSGKRPLWSTVPCSCNSTAM